MARELLIEEFKEVAAPIPAIQHPWFRGVIGAEFTEEQLVLGEQQHYLRGRLNGVIFGVILRKAFESGDNAVIEVARANHDEEVGGAKTHGDLMYQFLEVHGMTKEEAAAIPPKPGTMAAISMLTKGIQSMTALEAIAMMSLPELQNAPASAAMYKTLSGKYGFSDYAIETYAVHSEADIGHGDIQLSLLADKVEADPSLKPSILRAMEFGVNAFNFEWDGHYQAVLGRDHFHWDGV